MPFNLSDPAFVANVTPSGGPLDVTNVEKLSLPLNTPLETQVAVSDGFYVSNIGPDDVGFYFVNGTADGKEKYTRFPSTPNEDIVWNSNDLQWRNAGGVFSNDDTVHFWDATDAHADHDGYVVTHPALQQLAAASTAQGGVFVSGGTQDGVYTLRSGLCNGKVFGNLLGQPDDNPSTGDGNSAVAWTNGSGDFRWDIIDGAGGGLYYSTSAVATPDLASNWKNASDDSPASISVTSVTVSALNAGVIITAGAAAGVYTNRGAFNGNSYWNRIDKPDNPSEFSIIFHAATRWSIYGASSSRLFKQNGSTIYARPWNVAAWDLDEGSAPLPDPAQDNVANEGDWV